MKTVYRDQRTGTLYPADIVENWGRDGVGDGYGIEPRAFHLIEREYNDIDPATGAPVKRKYFEVSRGELDRQEVSDAAAADAEKAFEALRFSRPVRWRGKTISGPPNI